MARVVQAVTGIEDIFKGLEAFSTLREPIARAMGVAMGQTVRDEAIVRAPELKPGDEGYDNQRRGQLKEALYLAFDGRRSILNAGHLVYQVSWNAKKAPHGHLVEFGHWMAYKWARGEEGKFYTPLQGTHKVDGRKRGKGYPIDGGGFYVNTHPFLGPAFDAKLPRLGDIATEAGKAAFSKVMK
jgi:hypothetical protein